MNTKVAKPKVAQVTRIEQPASEKPLAVRDESPMHMLQTAIAQKMDPQIIKELMDLRDRWEANEARKAFTVAMTGFKSEPIQIFKTKQVRFETQTGTTSYKHAELSDITAAIAEPLSKYALSYRWEVSQGEGITVACILTHAAGHSERVTMTAPADDSGKKNRIQQIASTVSYLERYTLLAVTGLSTTGMDDDAKAAGDTLPRVTGEQADNLQALLDECPPGTKDRFLKYMQVETLDDIAAQAYSECVRQLEARRKSGGK
jgi:hypothetical protein